MGTTPQETLNPRHDKVFLELLTHVESLNCPSVSHTTTEPSVDAVFGC